MVGDIHHPIGVPLRARVSFLVLERGTLHASRHALRLEKETGTVDIPCAKASVLFLEPGVSVTHAAVKLCADMGTLLLWTGEAGVRLYSAWRAWRASWGAGTSAGQIASVRTKPNSRCATFLSTDVR